MNTQKRYPYFLAVLVAAILTATMSMARSIGKDVGTTGFSFLKINVGARPVAMGGAFTGLADDESSLYYNPAGITAFDSKRFILEYNNYFVDLQSGFLGYIHSPSENRVMAVHLSYLNYGKFVQTSRSGDVTGEFSGGDLVLAATYALKQGDHFSFGATGKFIYEKVQSYSATGASLDLGAKYSALRGRYNAGIAIQNLGVQFSGLGSDKPKLPLTLRAGAAARLRGLPMVVSSDLIIPVDNKVSVAFGSELTALKPLFVRLGWNSTGLNYRAQNSKDKWAGLSVGVGFDIKNMQLSYALLPAADLGESHRITLTGGI